MTAHLQLVLVEPDGPDHWSTLAAAATRTDVPADVQAAALAALAYRATIVRELAVQQSLIDEIAVEQEACRW